MIQPVTYYQAVCDVCGTVDDDGEYSAWGDPDTARMSAVDVGWTELTVPALPGTSGPSVYRVQRSLDSPPVVERSILVCEAHSGDGLHWCATCDEDLDPKAWQPHFGPIIQACPNQHRNVVRLRKADR